MAKFLIQNFMNMHTRWLKAMAWYELYDSLLVREKNYAINSGNHAIANDTIHGGWWVGVNLILKPYMHACPTSQ